MRRSSAMAKFIKTKTADGYDVIINTDTIKYIERNPSDRENSVWVWTEWANNGYVVINENIDDFRLKLVIK